MIHHISGKVIDGDKIGRTLWFPTANIQYISDDIPSSVFQVNVVLEWKTYLWMWVHAKWKNTFEVHLFEFSWDIYGETIDIYLLKEIRKNQKFDSLESLSHQLEKDKEIVSQTETKVVTFGTFDVFHQWHMYYLSEAKKYGTHLSTIIARDKTVEKIKWFTPKNPETQRLKDVEESGISNTVILWDLENPLIPLQKIQPDIICLGYDQKSFPDFLEKYISEKNIDTVRIESFHPEIYKSSKLK